jgi:hypothetical protein
MRRTELKADASHAPQCLAYVVLTIYHILTAYQIV